MKTEKEFDVICAGAATWDQLFTGVDEDIMRTDSIVPEVYEDSSGGDAVNAAISMARLGRKVTLCALTGNDSSGMLIRNDLLKAGVNTDHMTARDNVNTSAPVILVDQSGERHIIRMPNSANHFFTQDMVSDEVLLKARHLHFASANVMSAMDGKPLGILFQRAHALGLTTSLDASYDKNGRGMDNIEDALHHCDIFFPSLQEASMYAGTSDQEEIAAFFSRYPLKCFGIKLGEKGEYVTDFQNRWTLASLYHEKPVDTTGAGDAFFAAFVSAWLEGFDLPSCACFGSAHAASVLSGVGANRTAGTAEDAKKILFDHQITLKKR